MTALGLERGRLLLHRDRRPPAGQGLGIRGSPGVPALHAFTRGVPSPLPAASTPIQAHFHQQQAWTQN